MMPIRLYINIDHVATVRQARGPTSPIRSRPPRSARRPAPTGSRSHLREDRRHIQDDDVERLAPAVPGTQPRARDQRRDRRAGLPAPSLPGDPGTRAAGGSHHRGRARPPPAQSAAARGDPAGWTRRASGSASSSIPRPRRSMRPRTSACPRWSCTPGRYAHTWRQERSRRSASCARAARHAARHGALRARRPRPDLPERARRSPPSPEIEELNIGHSIVSRAVMVGMRAAVRGDGALGEGREALIPCLRHEPIPWAPPTSSRSRPERASTVWTAWCPARTRPSGDDLLRASRVLRGARPDGIPAADRAGRGRTRGVGAGAPRRPAAMGPDGREQVAQAIEEFRLLVRRVRRMGRRRHRARGRLGPRARDAGRRPGAEPMTIAATPGASINAGRPRLRRPGGRAHRQRARPGGARAPGRPRRPRAALYRHPAHAVAPRTGRAGRAGAPARDPRRRSSSPSATSPACSRRRRASTRSWPPRRSR